MPVNVLYFHSCFLSGPSSSIESSGPTTGVGLELVILKSILAASSMRLIKNGRVIVNPVSSGILSITQPFLIKRILEAANIDLRMTNSRPTPVVGPILSRDEDGPDRKHEWNYRTLTGMLGYLQGTSMPDISMATHQCAGFSLCPKLFHERAVKRICKYLLDTNDKGIIFQLDPTKGLECHVNAEFSGGWASG